MPILFPKLRILRKWRGGPPPLIAYFPLYGPSRILPSGSRLLASISRRDIQGDLFSRAIRQGGEVPVPLEDAAKTMAVIDAVFLAAETGRRESPADVLRAAG